MPGTIGIGHQNFEQMITKQQEQQMGGMLVQPCWQTNSRRKCRYQKWMLIWIRLDGAFFKMPRPQYRLSYSLSCFRSVTFVSSIQSKPSSYQTQIHTFGSALLQSPYWSKPSHILLGGFRGGSGCRFKKHGQEEGEYQEKMTKAEL